MGIEMEEQIPSRTRSSMLGSHQDHPVPVGVTMKVMTERSYAIWFKLYSFDPMRINNSCTDCF